MKQDVQPQNSHTGPAPGPGSVHPCLRTEDGRKSSLGTSAGTVSLNVPAILFRIAERRRRFEPGFLDVLVFLFLAGPGVYFFGEILFAILRAQDAGPGF